VCSSDLVIHWREADGPPVKAPTHQGFGSTIIGRSIPYDLGGTAELAYPREGFTARFSIPARHVGEAKAAVREAAVITTPSAPPPPLQAELRGLSVLLVEDSLIIALDAEDCLLQLGAARVASVAGVEQALQEIARERPGLALLDINLGQENSFPIAERLLALGVPFFFTTGYGERLKLPPALAGKRVLQKPYTPEGIAKAVAAVLATPG
jgi:CheY-like chemotaxis protein